MRQFIGRRLGEIWLLGWGLAGATAVGVLIGWLG